jgi:hypothetical protein
MVETRRTSYYVQIGPKSAAARDGLAGTARREFLADFREHDLTIEARTGGRFGTDTGSFSEKGVPTVGLYTGAGGPKSEAQANMFGGAAGRPYDPCYHQACDTVENINREVLEENTRALVRVLKAVTIVPPVSGTPARKAEETPEPRL